MKTMIIIPLLALLAVTGCGNHATETQSNPNNSGLPVAPTPAPANPDSTNAVTPPPNNGEMTPPTSGANTNAPADTNNPSTTNQTTGS